MSIHYLFMDYILIASHRGNKMKTALIIGITGNFGSQMALALTQHGWKVKALMRDTTMAPDYLDKSSIFQGNANNKGDVLKAAQQADVLVYAVNSAYHRWHLEALPMLESCLQVAESLGLRVLFPGNVYNYQPQQTLINENDEQTSLTQKGVIRQKMEQRLFKASQQGAKVMIVRAGDFIGPKMKSGWLEHILKQKKNYWQVSMPHNNTHTHFWTYLPDLCLNATRLLEQAEHNIEIWHDPGLALKTSDWQQAFNTNGAQTKITVFPWVIFKIIALFSAELRAVIKMRYLWQEHVVLDGQKMKNKLAQQWVSTPFKDILAKITDSTKY